MAQENRSFDSHFGQLSAYWAANGYPAQRLDGMPANAVDCAGGVGGVDHGTFWKSKNSVMSIWAALMRTK